MADSANYSDVQRALSEEPASIRQQIPVAEVQLYQPLDGRGARIRASVHAKDRRRVPSQVKVVLDGRDVTIPVEAMADYEEVKAY